MSALFELADFRVRIGTRLGPAEIVNGVEISADQIQENATAAEEQSATSEEINRSIDEINGKGGVAGYKIDATFTDSKVKPAYAVRVAKRYITEDEVDFLFGVVSSGVVLAVTEISKQYKTIFIGTDHASTRLTVDNFQPYYFRVSNNTFQSMTAGALYLKELAETKPWKKIAFIGPDYAYGHSQWDEIRYNLDRFGIPYEVVGEYWPLVRP